VVLKLGIIMPKTVILKFLDGNVDVFLVTLYRNIFNLVESIIFMYVHMLLHFTYNQWHI